MTQVQRTITIWSSAWCLVTFGLFFFGFGFFDSRTASTKQELVSVQSQFYKLQAEEQGVKLAKQDLENIKQRQLQPDDFFKKDTTLVDQVVNLENLSKKYNLTFQLGLSGTVNSGVAVPGNTSLVRIPFSISLNGKFIDVLRFLESFEHMSYIAHADNLNITAAGQGNVGATMGAGFFIRK